MDGDWCVSHPRLVTDGWTGDAERVIGEFEEQGCELDRDDDPGRNPPPVGDQGE